MERQFWLICIYFAIRRIEWRIRSELVCVESNYVYSTVSFKLSDLSQTWQTVSQSAVWVAMCHQHTAPSARSLFNKDRLCFETLPLSVGFPPVFVLSPPLLSFPLLRTEEDVRCWKRKNYRFVLLVGSDPNPELHLKSLFSQLVIAYKDLKNFSNAHITWAHGSL